MTEKEKFTKQFHSICGINTKEKQRSFNLFVKSLQSSIDERDELTDLVDFIKPRDQLEQIFKMKLMIQFKIYSLLEKELQASNPIFLRKLLKNWRIFGDFFMKINSQTFIDDILPHLSYALKLQLLNGISKNVKNEYLLDGYFLAIEEKYGMKLAMILLPGCSIKIIRPNIQRYRIQLSNRCLLNIFKKDKEFVEYYFDILNSRKTNINFSHNYAQVLKHLAKIDSKLYWQLHKKYNFTITFGKHTTPMMVRSNSEIEKDGLKYISNLQLRQLHKTVKKDSTLIQFVSSLYPEAHTEFQNTFQRYSVSQFMNCISPSQRYLLITSLFKEKYGKNLLDHVEYCNEDFVKIIPVNEREMVLNKLMRNNEELIYLYTPSKAIPMIKERIQHCSDKRTRTNLVSLLYKTCAASKDHVALAETLEYMMSRHKNDTNALGIFFNCFLTWPKVIDLDANSWKHIADIAKLLEISKPNFIGANFYSKYICYLLKQSKPCQEVYKQYLQSSFKQPYYYSQFQGEKTYEQRFIEEMGNYILSFKGDQYYQNICINFLYYLVNYNLANKRNRVSLDDYSHFFDQLKLTDCYCSPIVIRYGVTNSRQESWHDLFWKHSKEILDCETLCWYVKNRPEKLAENIDTVISCLDTFIWKPERFLHIASKILDDNTRDKIIMNALNRLRGDDKTKISDAFKTIYILSPKSLFEFVTPLLPNPGVKIAAAGLQNKLIKRTLIKKLHRIPEPIIELFPLVLKFCTAEYLKLALPPLYSVAYNTPEIHIVEYLTPLCNEVTSIRKHFLILGRYLFSREKFIDLLKEFTEKETNPSVRNILLIKNMQYLIENPSDSLWILFKKNIKLIDNHDREMYDLLMKVETIPKEYLAEYIHIVYREISNNLDNEIKKKKYQLITVIPTNVIDNLDAELLKEIITETANLEDTSNFHWKCVFYTNGMKQEELFEKNFEIVRHLVEENRSNLKRNSKVYAILTNFVTRFLNVTYDMKQGGNLIQKFMIYWTAILQLDIFCRNYTMLQFADLHFKSNFDPYKTGVAINKLFHTYLQTLGSSATTLFATHLIQFLNGASIEKQERVTFVEGLFDNRQDENLYIVVMQIVLKSQKSGSSQFTSIANIIKKCDIPIIKFHLESSCYSLYQE